MPAETESIVEIIGRVAAALDEAQVPYAVGGSVVSGYYGDPRSTNDVDFAIRMRTDQLARFADALGPDFDVDREALLDAIEHGRSWNVFFTPSMLKIDLFARGSSDYDQGEFARVRRVTLIPGSRSIAISSAEDNLLWKLRWFRQGGEVSDQQWRDIQGIVRVSGGLLDVPYLDRWAAEWGVLDLLNRARGPSEAVTAVKATRRAKPRRKGR